MRTAAICPTCATYENAVCVIYNGPTLTNINVPPLTNLEVALGSINTSIGSVIALINSVAANPISLTTTGTSGPATLTGNALNVPNYQPTLQEVLTNDNNTDQTIVITNGAGTISNTLSPGNIEIKDITNNTYAYYTEDYIYLYDQNTTGTSYVNFPDPNDNATFNFPSTGGTLAITSDITLQNITSGTNKNLTNGINLQGTGAGDNNTGTQDINAFGLDAAKNNSGAIVNAFGRRAAENNTGNNVVAFGIDSAGDNTGDYVNSIGSACLTNNTGSYVNAIGLGSGNNNSYSYINLFGFGATASANNQVVFSKDAGAEVARIGYGGITSNRLYTLPNASGELVISVNGVTPVNGNVTIPAGNTQQVKVSLTSADILALTYASPFQLIPAPGAGKYIEVLAITGRYVYNTTPYSVNTTINYRFGVGASGGIALGSVTNALNQTFNTYHKISPSFTTTAFDIENKPITIDAGALGSPVLGDGTLDVYITYSEVTL